jgi:iron complex transport system ATP-binding protein
MNTLLEIKSLTCGYEPGFSIQDINFSLEAEEFVGIIGPNGSGKTTFLRAIIRFLKPRRGAVFFEGKDIRQFGFKEFARKIAVVSQNPPVSDMTVEEFVLLGRIPHFGKMQFLESVQDFEAAHKVMSLTQTLQFKDRMLRELSGGERQLVFIARALAQEPRLLLLDEPTTHLDITHQVAVLDLLKRLNREQGLTVMIVLHDLNLASEYCKRLVLVREGKVYKAGSPKEVLSYEIIEAVYKTVVVVRENPISLRPYVLLVPEEERGNRSKY